MGFTMDKIKEVIMDQNKALAKIKETWRKSELSLENKIITISGLFDKAELDITTTAIFIEVTPAEFDAFLSLSKLDKDIIKEISNVNPPKTTWPLLASGNDVEIKKALAALSDSTKPKKNNETSSEIAVRNMREESGDTFEELLSKLTVNDLYYLAKKAKNFFIDNWNVNFLNSIAKQKTRGKVLSTPQIETLINILNNLADNNVIKRNSIDGDRELCDKVLDVIGR